MKPWLIVDALQSTLGNHITNKRLSPEEIIAACLGLKKIQGKYVDYPNKKWKGYFVR